MSGYVRDIVIKKRWEGDDVTVVMLPIKYGDMFAIGKSAPLQESFEKMKPYTKTLSGLKAHDASDVTIDEVYSSAFFIDLLTEIFKEWLSKATPQNPPSPGA